MDPVELLRAQMEYQSLRSLARRMRIAPTYLSAVMRRTKAPGPKILRYLKLERVPGPVSYRLKVSRQKKQIDGTALAEVGPMS